MFFDLVNKRTTAASAAALLIAGYGGGTGSFTATTDLENNFKAALGPHLVMVGLKVRIEEGRSYPLTLVFERGGSMPVSVSVGDQ